MDTEPTARATTPENGQPSQPNQETEQQPPLPPLQQLHDTTAMPRSEASTASTASDRPPQNDAPTDAVAPAPVRPGLSKRESSDAMNDGVEESSLVGTYLDPGDVRAMSPRRTTEDIEKLGRQTREELRQHAKMLQESLLAIFHRIQAVQEEHDKLDSNNKFLQKYIGDLMATSKITASGSGSRGKK